MKRYFFLFVLSLFLVGCSSDGSREIQIDEVKFVPDGDHHTLEDYKNVCSVLEVVPGKYELAWTRVHNLPQHQNYNISLKLKLRLKRTVKLKPEVMDKVTNVNKENDPHPILSPFIFCLIDANGKKEEATVQHFDLTYSPMGEWSTSGTFNKDQSMDFLRFLQSKPGTEIELVINAIGAKNKDRNCIEICKGAKGIVCEVQYTDEDFTKWRFGTIE